MNQPRTTYLTPDLFSGLLPDWEAPTHSGPAKTAIALHFDDVAALASYGGAERRADAWCEENVWRDNYHFVGCTTGQAHDYAANGWTAGAAQAERLRGLLIPHIPQAPRIRAHGVAGATPNVARALAGNPLNMRRTAIADSTRRPVVTLCAGVATHHGTPADSLLATAVANCAIIDTLEGAGYRVEAIALWRGSRAGFGIEIAVRVKSGPDVVNLASLAYVLGHPAVLRSLMFAAVASTPEMSRIGEGFGFVVHTETAKPDAGIYNLPTAKGGATPLSAFKRAIASLRVQGCPGIPPAEDA